MNRISGGILKLIGIAAIIVILLYSISENIYSKTGPKTNLYYGARAQGQSYYINNKGNWKEIFIKGISMGVTIPGMDTRDKEIPYSDYYKWFGQISDMNVNVIRVYAKQSREFYRALYDYNINKEKPLYFMQGIWFEDGTTENEYSIESKRSFIKEGQILCDTIYGKNEREGYQYNLSPYMIGWILGVEWNPIYIDKVNKKENPSYKGRYLMSESSGFESFLSEVGDKLIEYETNKYKAQRPISFINWPTTDNLIHPQEPFELEDKYGFSMENIKVKGEYYPGLFATYHIYPWYPEFISLQDSYSEYRDKRGNKNNYEAYLKELVKNYSIPVVIGEFGASSSRGMTHRQIDGIYQQGGLSEEEQGYRILDMMDSIYTSGSSGGFIFSWQDEWFKNVWNIRDLTNASRNKYWHNAENSEEYFGILAMEAGREKEGVYIDGEVEEWKKEEPIFESSSVSLYIRQDEAYLYIMAKLKENKLEDKILLIPIDSLPNFGEEKPENYNIRFANRSEFLIVINGQSESRIMVAEDYDIFSHSYGIKTGDKNFHKINQMMRPEINNDRIMLATDYYESGKLTFGISNPYSQSYNSLSDFYYKDKTLEIRIPWYLLGFGDPSRGRVIDDFRGQSKIKFKEIKDIKIGAGIVGKDDIIKMSKYRLEPWGENVEYFQRLKQSYTILQEGLIKYE